MYKQNLHTHTTYVDGKDTPEQMLLAAIDKGFDSIGFSEHSFLPYSAYTSRFTPERMAAYRDEIRALKQKYQGAIDVFCGLEYDAFSDFDTAGFDYLIGSVHYIDCGENVKTFDVGLEGTLAYIAQCFAGDAFAFAKKYYETLASLPERGNFDIIGHFDLIAKNNEQGRFLDTSSKTYLDLGLEAIHALQGRIPLFELNTGAIARGYRTSPYPQMEFLKEFNACGFGATVSSDCHNKDLLDVYFDEAFELLSAVGFRSVWILTDDGFREIGI